jgi:hypothetical protein
LCRKSNLPKSGGEPLSFSTLGGKTRRIAQMEDNFALEPLPIETGPSSSKNLFSFVMALPSELDCGLSVSLSELAIHFAVDIGELKLACSIAFEFYEGLEFLRFLFNVPLIHFFNGPATLKRICRFALPHEMSPCGSKILIRFKRQDVDSQFKELAFFFPADLKNRASLAKMKML